MEVSVLQELARQLHDILFPEDQVGRGGRSHGLDGEGVVNHELGEFGEFCLCWLNFTLQSQVSAWQSATLLPTKRESSLPKLLPVRIPSQAKKTTNNNNVTLSVPHWQLSNFTLFVKSL